MNYDGWTVICEERIVTFEFWTEVRTVDYQLWSIKYELWRVKYQLLMWSINLELWWFGMNHEDELSTVDSKLWTLNY